MRFLSSSAQEPRSNAAKGNKVSRCLLALLVASSIVTAASPALAYSPNSGGFTFFGGFFEWLVSPFGGNHDYGYGYGGNNGHDYDKKDKKEKKGKKDKKGKDHKDGPKYEDHDKSVPEPLTVLGTASALGVGLLLRKSYGDKAAATSEMDAELS